jgi:subtilisin family serine protease
MVSMVAADDKAESSATIEAYEDVRSFSSQKGKDLLSVDIAELAMVLPTLTFNEDTVWPASLRQVAKHTMESAKEPGLDVRSVHSQGITGDGVSVGIIDQPLLQDHPEYAGKIVAYRNFVTGNGSESSMHGPAVTSILVGETIGVAPGARVFYAAVPSWLGDSEYYARALDWIVAENDKLPAGKKIRVVSVSAAPSGPGSPFEKNNEMWENACDRAMKAGILILDCTSNDDRGLIGPCYHEASESRDSVSLCKYGFPGLSGRSPSGRRVLAPCSPRTTAEVYVEGSFKYQYDGRGGLSWGIPYAAGVLALGWQVRPDLDQEQMVSLLKDTAFPREDGTLVIWPVKFITRVLAIGQ